MTPHAVNTDRDLLDRAAAALRRRAIGDVRFQSITRQDDGGQSFTRDEAAAGDFALPETERLYRRLEYGRGRIGDMPPQPPTMRGRIGSYLVALVRRALFWYTGQIQEFQANVSEAAGEQMRSSRALRTEQARQAERLASLTHEFAELKASLDATAAELSQDLSRISAELKSYNLPQLAQDLARARQAAGAAADNASQQLTHITRELARHDGELAHLNGELSRQDAELARHKAQLARLGSDVGNLGAEIAIHDGELARLAAELAGHGDELARRKEDLRTRTKENDSRVAEISRQLYDTRAQLLQQQLRTTVLLRELRSCKTSSQSSGLSVPPDTEIPAAVRDPLFIQHAIRFRGATDEIKNRLALYLPDAQQAFQAAGNAPALDLGCGRGEWLDLLHQAGIPCTGVDQNSDLVRACQERGLDAVQSDLLAYLRALPDESRSTVTAFHIIEHLPFEDLVELLGHASRVLRPGGTLILETPNPRNLFVSCYNFYLDPTHRQPLPNELVALLVEVLGLCDPKVIPLHPYPEAFHLEGSECSAVRFINEHFYGPQDYAIVARRP